MESVERRADRLCYLFLVFLTGCLVGWVYEEIFYWITEGMLRNRGILYGPWLPIYGIGALGIYAMKPAKESPVLLFVLCGVVAGIVCLRSVLSFAVMGLVFHYLLEPAAERLVSGLNRRILHSSCLVVLLLFLVDCILSALFRTPITY